MYSAIAAGISANTASDQATAINTWLLTLPLGSVAFFPTVGSPTSQTAYYVSHAIEVPRGVKIMGPGLGFDAPRFTALPSYTDSQIMRNWQTADGTGFYAPNTTAWNTSGVGNNYVQLENIGFDVNGNSNITCLALVHIQELTVIQQLKFTNSQAGGTGNTAFALFSNGESLGTCSGRYTINQLIGYGKGWKNFIYVDGTNGESQTANSVNDLNITEITTPAGGPGGGNQITGAVCSDSPIFVRKVQRLLLTGHQEIAPPNATSDTAGVRIVNCSEVCIRDYYYLVGSLSYKPFFKSTQDGSNPTIGGSQVGPVLRNVSFIGGGGWASRTDASCGITAGDVNVTDTSIAATDLYRPVYGPGIPSGAYITAIVAGVSFALSVAPILTGTVALVVSANVLEDESAVGGSIPGTGVVRHFQFSAKYFQPRSIIDYTGTEIRWLQFQTAATSTIRYARSAASGETAINQMSPQLGIAESLPRFYGTPTVGTGVLTSGTLHLTGLFLYPGDLVSALSYWSGSTALATATNWWMALLDPSLNLVSISADQLTASWSAAQKKTLAMGAPYFASLPAVHYSGLMVKATTAPNIEAATQENIGSQLPVLAGNSTAALTTPASCPATAAALTYVAGRPYVSAT